MFCVDQEQSTPAGFPEGLKTTSLSTACQQQASLLSNHVMILLIKWQSVLVFFHSIGDI